MRLLLLLLSLTKSPMVEERMSEERLCRRWVGACLDFVRFNISLRQRVAAGVRRRHKTDGV